MKKLLYTVLHKNLKNCANLKKLAWFKSKNCDALLTLALLINQANNQHFVIFLWLEKWLMKYYSQIQLIFFDRPSICTFHTCRTCTSLGRKRQYLIRFCSFFPGMEFESCFWPKNIFLNSIFTRQKLLREKKLGHMKKYVKNSHSRPLITKSWQERFYLKTFFSSWCRKTLFSYIVISCK